MSKESNEVADLRCFVIALNDELEFVSGQMTRLMGRLDAYQMVLEGLCVTHQDQQTVLREIATQIEQLAQFPATETGAQERYIGQIMEHLVPLMMALGQPGGSHSG